MMDPKQDIYKKDEIPRFARKNYKSRNITLVGSKKKKSTNTPQPPENEPSVEEKTGSGHGENAVKHRHRTRSSRKKKTNKGVLAACVGGSLAYLLLLGSVITVKKQQQKKQRDSIASKNKPVTETSVQPREEVEPSFVFSSLKVRMENWKSAEGIRRKILDGSLGKSDEARKKIEAQLKITPYDEALLFELAAIQYAGNEHEETFETLFKTLNINPLHKDAQMLLGNALLRIQDYEGARLIGEWILEKDTFNSKAHTIVANAYLNMDKLALAIKHLHAVVDFDSRNLVAQNNLGVAYFRSENYSRAIRIFENILAQEQLNSVVYYNLSVCYARLNKASKAVEILDKAANHFGYVFIKGWLEKDDYNMIRSAPEYAKLRKRIADNPDSNATFKLSTVKEKKYEKDLSIDDVDFGIEVTR